MVTMLPLMSLVSNKWIRLHEQFLTAPCGLHPLDKFKTP